ncbi:MAG: PorV/PorQ family protein [candidate division WOR-3 bacterium]|nr:PorV/PorQ family protein [candidate division WOR-3 bacterium]
MATPVLGCLAALVLLGNSAFAVGETGAQFLKMGVGARACAMGEAFAAVADDASAIYWNPAGLRKLERTEVLGMQNFWLLDMSYQYVAAVVPSRLGTFGVAAAYSSSGKIPRYEGFRKVGEYSAYDAAGTIGYANHVARLNYGASLKLIQQAIDTVSATGFAADLGLLYDLGMLSAGVAVQNIGPSIKFIEKADPLPLNVKAGLAAKVGPVVLVVDANKARDNGFRLNVGAEGVVLGLLALRAGYNTANSFTAGGGVTWKMVSVDYAFVPYKEIDATHRISARVRF